MCKVDSFLTLTFLSVICILCTSCSNSIVVSKNNTLPNGNSEIATARDKGKALQQAAAAKTIREVDFQNFTYPYPRDPADSDKRSPKSYTLHKGELPPTRDKDGFIDKMGIDLVGVNYGDVTGDSSEEAIVVLSILTGGSALPNIVYIYTWQNTSPNLLWSFSTSDRADDGLRDVYIKDDKLIVELYTPIDKRGDCCPLFFKRYSYFWHNNRFRQKGKAELLPNPERNGSLHFFSGRTN